MADFRRFAVNRLTGPHNTGPAALANGLVAQTDPENRYTAGKMRNHPQSLTGAVRPPRTR